jgi:hypothetical protein
MLGGRAAQAAMLAGSDGYTKEERWKWKICGAGVQ